MYFKRNWILVMVRDKLGFFIGGEFFIIEFM